MVNLFRKDSEQLTVEFLMRFTQPTNPKNYLLVQPASMCERLKQQEVEWVLSGQGALLLTKEMP